MPQLNKGGKWVFGWVIVGPRHEIQIPPEAYSEYGFRPGEVVSFTYGSHKSGGFGLGRQEILRKNQQIQMRILMQGIMGVNRLIVLPQALEILPSERLLAVRGSNFALGFLQRGPIYETALHHTEIEIFGL